MKIKDVVILEEVADDLNDGRMFYDEKDQSVGDYFWKSLLVDIQSLFIYGGVHSRTFRLYRMLAKRFPYAIYCTPRIQPSTSRAMPRSCGLSFGLK
jgi:hypothetical protein